MFCVTSWKDILAEESMHCSLGLWEEKESVHCMLLTGKGPFCTLTFTVYIYIHCSGRQRELPQHFLISKILAPKGTSSDVISFCLFICHLSALQRCLGSFLENTGLSRYGRKMTLLVKEHIANARANCKEWSPAAITASFFLFGLL